MISIHVCGLKMNDVEPKYNRVRQNAALSKCHSSTGPYERGSHIEVVSSTSPVHLADDCRYYMVCFNRRACLYHNLRYFFSNVG
jgi:hypothetical protein